MSRTDPGPSALDVPDSPDDEFTDRDTTPRPGDGPQDVDQNPNSTPEGA